MRPRGGGGKSTDQTGISPFIHQCYAAVSYACHAHTHSHVRTYSNGFSLPHIGLGPGSDNSGATLASACGNFLRMRNVGNGTESYIECPKSDISAFAVSPTLDRVAVCAGTIDPDLYVYSTQTSELMCTIPAGSELDYKMVTFSSDGNMLLSVSSEPQLSLNVWLLTAIEKESDEEDEASDEGTPPTLESQSILEAEIQLSAFQGFAPSLTSPNHFVTCGEGVATGWFIEKHYMGYELNQSALDTGKKTVTCVTWLPLSGTCVLGCESGELLCIAAHNRTKDSYTVGDTIPLSADEALSNSSNAAITSVSASTQVIAALAGGRVLVYRLDSMSFAYSIPLVESADSSMNSLGFLSMQFDMEENTLYAITTRNELVRFSACLATGGPAAGTLIDSSHCRGVTGITALPGRPADIATCSHDGTLRVWDFDASASTPVVTKDVGGSCSAMTACAHGILVGSALGVLRLCQVNIAEKTISTLDRCRVHDSAISFVTYDVQTSTIATSSMGTLFFTSLRSSSMEVIGCMHFPGEKIVSCDWLALGDSRYVMTAFKSGKLAVVKGPGGLALDAPRDLCLNGLLPMKLLCFSSDGQVSDARLSAAPRAESTEKLHPWQLLFWHGADRTISVAAVDLRDLEGMFASDTRDSEQQKKDDEDNATIVGQDDDANDDGEQPLPMLEKLATVEGHLKLGGVLALSDDGMKLLSGGRDGAVKLFDVSLPTTANDDEHPIPTTIDLILAAETFTHGSNRGGASYVAFGGNGQHAYSAGHDGSMFRYRTTFAAASADGIEQTMVDEVLPLSKLPADAHDAENEVTAIEANIERETTKRRERNVAWVNDVKLRLSALSGELSDLLVENERSHVMERLDRSEFVIDDTLKKIRDDRAELEVAKLRRSIRSADVETMIVRERIKKHCYDSMAVQRNTCAAFDSDMTVTSYPLVHEAPDYAKKLEHVSFLRRVELDEIEYHMSLGVVHNLALELVEAPDADDGEADAQAGGSGTGSGTAGSTVGAGSKGANPKGAGSDIKGGGGGGGGAGGDGGTAADNEFEESTSKTTDAGVLASDDKSSSRNLLYTAYELNSVQRRISQSFLLRREVRERQSGFNDAFAAVKARKLDDIHKIMDHNQRLREINKELGVDENIADPRITQEEETDRILTVEDDEVGVLRFVSPEEQARLDAETRAEADRLAKRSDDDPAERALKMMMGGRLDRDKDTDNAADFIRPDWMSQPRETLSEEQIKFMKEFEAKEKLYLEEMERQKKALETEFKKIKTDIHDIRSRFDDALSELFQRKLDTEAVCTELELQIIRMTILTEQAIEEYEIRDADLQNELEDLKVEKGKSSGVMAEFRRDLDIVRDQHDAMMADLHAMDRAFRKDLVEAGENNVDMLYRMYKRKNIHSEHGVGGVVDPNERPEGVSESIWELLLERRRVKHSKEAEIRLHHTKLNEMGMYMSKLSEQDDNLKNRIETVLKDQKEFRDVRIRNLLDLEIPLNLKQGQVENDLSTIHVDMSDAFLIDRKVVEEVNEIITRHGEAKTEVLVAIKDFKKGIYELQWENKKLQMEAEDLIEKTKELQLLRVTKNLQSILKHGEETSSQSEVTALEARLDHNKMLHEKHLIEKRKQIQKMRSSVEEKRLHNDYLLKQIRELEQTVDNLEQLRNQSRTQYDGSRSTCRMRNLMTQRKLQDLSLAQQEEIQMLQTELEKMKLRSFPSFTFTEVVNKRDGRV